MKPLRGCSVALSIVALMLVGCDDGTGADQSDLQQTDSDSGADSDIASPSVRFEVDGTLVVFDDPVVNVTGNAPERLLTISATDGTDTWSFTTEETFIGFVDGLNVWMYEGTEPHEVTFVSGGVTYSTTTTPHPGIQLAFWRLEDRPAGAISAQFSGVLSDGSVEIEIGAGEITTSFAE